MRSFHVRPLDLPHHRGREVAEVSFEAAAIAFAEAWPPAGAEVDVLAVVVREHDTGRELCLRVDLATGAAAPCSPAGGPATA